MDPTTRFKTNTPPVVYETVSGETILVHLETGSYYDMNASGGIVFECFAGGASVREAIEVAASRFAVDPGAIAPQVEDFLSEVAAEGLLTDDDGPGSGPGPAEDAPPVGSTWEPPAFNRHSDMRELLMLDPVHEVDAGGWPARA